MANEDTEARRCRGERLLAWALVAGALMSGLNAFIQVSRMLLGLYAGLR